MNPFFTPKKSLKFDAAQLALRKELWPEITEEEIWHRIGSNGFTTIPRTLPIIMRIFDNLSSGKPLSLTYLTLWSFANDRSVVRIHGNQDLYASVSGFPSSRGVYTWEGRIMKLRELGFIKIAPGGGRKIGYVLILDPYVVVKKLKEVGKVTEMDWSNLFSTAQTYKIENLQDKPVEAKKSSTPKKRATKKTAAKKSAAKKSAAKKSAAKKSAKKKALKRISQL